MRTGSEDGERERDGKIDARTESVGEVALLVALDGDGETVLEAKMPS